MINRLLRWTVLSTICVAWIAPPLRADEAEARAALREAGFKLRETPDGTELGFGQPEWTPETWKLLGEVTSLTTLRGTAKCADNAGLEVLVGLPRLKTLYLNGSTFDDEGFAVLARIKSLEALALDHNGTITGRGAAALKALPHLRSLRFGGCMKFTGEGVKSAAEITQLESLQIHHCRAGDDDLVPLAGMPNLKSLFVSGHFNGRFTGAGLATLAKIDTLDSLKVAETVVTYEDGLSALSDLKNLKRLELVKIGASEVDIEKLRAAMPETEITWTAASDEEIARFRRRAERLKERSK